MSAFAFNQVSTDLTVAVDKTDCSGLFSCVGGGCPLNHSVTSDTVTAAGSEGQAPYTYAWARVSGDATITATSAATAATAFAASVGRNATKTAVFQCTVTDNLGKQAVSAPVNVRLTYDWDSGL